MDTKKNINFIDQLSIFLEHNPSVNFLSINLSVSAVVEKLNHDTFTGTDTELLDLLKAYQRLIRILPQEHHAKAIDLISSGFSSAIQIAGMNKNEFVQQWEKMFGTDDTIAEIVHNNAMEKRSRVLVQYMDKLQSNEPHIKSARFMK